MGIDVRNVWQPCLQQSEKPELMVRHPKRIQWVECAFMLERGEKKGTLMLELELNLSRSRETKYVRKEIRTKDRLLLNTERKLG